MKKKALQQYIYQKALLTDNPFTHISTSLALTK